MKREKLAAIFLAIAIALFIVGSQRRLYEVGNIKLLMDGMRIALIFAYLLLLRRYLRATMVGTVIVSVGLVSTIVTGELFAFHAIAGAIVASIIVKARYDRVVVWSLWLSLVVTCIIVVGVKMGIIPSHRYFFPTYQEMGYSRVYKDDWGFWQPNIMSYVIAGNIMAAFYLRKRVALVLALALFGVVIATSEVSRTYLVVPAGIVALYLGTKCLGEKSKVLAFLAGAPGLVASLASVLFVLPSGVCRSILGASYYAALDLTLSHRLTIANDAIASLNALPYLYGLGAKHLVDSFYVNTVLQFGLLGYVVLVIYAWYLIVSGIRQGKASEVGLLSMVLVVGNFEGTANVTALVWLVGMLALFRIAYNEDVYLRTTERHASIGMRLRCAPGGSGEPA